MQQDGIQVEVEVESEDEGLRAGRRQTMYEETAHDTWPLSFRVPRRVAIALREEFERLKVEGKLGGQLKNLSDWLRAEFRARTPDFPWDEPLAVVDDQPEGE